MKPNIGLLSATDQACKVAFIAALAFAGLLAGCQSTGTKSDGVNMPMPAAYRNAAAPAPGEPEPAVRAIHADWWTQFGSEELNRLVDRALAHNADLRVATLQVAQAKIRADQVRAGRLPSITAPVRAVAQGQGTTNDSQQNSQATLAGTFRLDVWGEQRALVESAEMQLARAVHERENVQRTTIGNLVTSYIAYLSVSDSILIARENEAVAAAMLLSVERRMVLGDATSNDLEQQQAMLFNQQVVLPGLENQQEDLRSAISRLVAGLPGNLVLSERGLDALQVPVLNTGLPSALLLDRPDIRMMEARMRAANANIDVARARLLPPIDLSAQMGYSGATLASLLQPQNFLANTAAVLALTIFDGGVKKGEQIYAQSYYEEMVETYGKTVLQAIREVESALANLNATSRRLDAQRNVTRSALNIYKIGNDAFAAGAIDQTALLESRKNYQRSADETQRVKAELLRGYASLSYALGLGSVLVDMTEQMGTSSARRDTMQGDLWIGLVGFKLQLAPFSSKPIDVESEWEVELAGVYHRSSLLPLSRDLRERTSVDLERGGIRAVHLAHIDSIDEAWYRVVIMGFSSMKSSEHYCDGLKVIGLNCKVVSNSMGGQGPSKH